MTTLDWQTGCVVLCVGVSVGLSKTGLAGFGLVSVLLMAHVFGPLRSVGLLLPILIVGDVLATLLLGKHVDWKRLAVFLAASIPGLALGYFLIGVVDSGLYGKFMGVVVFIFCILNILRWLLGERIVRFVHGRILGFAIGVLSGTTTMMTNSAGPLAALYFLALSMPKFAVIGTAAWCFLVTNTLKLPLYAQLGLLETLSWQIFLWSLPGVAFGALLGSKVMPHLSQRLFEWLIILFAMAGALKLMIS
jgi:uncharacterized membrane protein YfcA